MMVEIFRTNVSCKDVSFKIVKLLSTQLPDHHFNFDLDDTENILRAEIGNHFISIAEILNIVMAQGFEIDLIS